jgi:hypothetical protein
MQFALPWQLALLITRRIMSNIAGQVSWLLAANANHAAFPSFARTVAKRSKRADDWLTSYSSATASDFHRLPYSA